MHSVQSKIGPHNGNSIGRSTLSNYVHWLGRLVRLSLPAKVQEADGFIYPFICQGRECGRRKGGCPERAYLDETNVS
jgi:hypothetical protein